MNSTTTTPQELKSCGLNNSFIPAIEESERFILYIAKKFGVKVNNDLLITINKAKRTAIGHFAPIGCNECFINGKGELNSINLNTLHIKKGNPYETLTHELAHYENNSKNIKDCSSNQYHNRNFKVVAERFLLKVEKGKKGYAFTTETEEFNKMLAEFKPNKEVFNIFQKEQEKKKKGSRLKLWLCSCETPVKVRCAVELDAICLKCGQEFKKQDDE
jgi:hypothetical protein